MYIEIFLYKSFLAFIVAYLQIARHIPSWTSIRDLMNQDEINLNPKMSALLQHQVLFIIWYCDTPLNSFLCIRTCQPMQHWNKLSMILIFVLFPVYEQSKLRSNIKCLSPLRDINQEFVLSIPEFLPRLVNFATNLPCEYKKSFQYLYHYTVVLLPFELCKFSLFLTIGM